jgi:hypothetical protein
MGVAQIKPKGKATKETVKQIAAEMQKYFKNTPGKMNYLSSYFFLFMGICLVTTSIFLFTLMSTHSSKNSTLPVKTQ